MDTVTVLGLLAGLCTTSAVVPQLLKAWKTKRVNDVSPTMFVILMLGVGLWVVYGILKHDLAIILTNGVSFLFNLSMLYVMIRYRKNGNR
ncbi:SemiSWEET family sugar transporter [Marixanthomonas spongiae]|uniref:MtN3 and saliva related transmembrane protein n=1 Tax=Marixanthomonas spongiae TaxID=2174845 RepID=A0A2U0I575_9FLAO|nr:SemiSWEET transporter [Marixanthomonas spongiae]PVW16249.1 hypothetical protein DDV96_02980 [Marixanthomonas spongiae]